jgi:hypothetical protein
LFHLTYCFCTLDAKVQRKITRKTIFFEINFRNHGFSVEWNIDNKAATVAIALVELQVATQVLGVSLGQGQAQSQSFRQVVDLGRT